MGIIITIIIVLAISGLLIRSRRSLVDTVEAPAPYKIETPVPTVEPVEEIKEVVSAGVATAKKPRKPRAPKAETAKKVVAKATPAKKTAGRKPKAK